MDHVHATIDFLIITGAVILAVVSAGHALLRKNDPLSALVWVVICLALPIIGPFFYWSIGANRIYRRTRKWRQSGRRLDGDEISSRGYGNAPVDDLPKEARHLETLRNLADRVVSAGLLGGARLSLLRNGEEAYPAMLSAIASARESVHLCTYIFDNDRTGRRVRHRSQGRSRPGGSGAGDHRQPGRKVFLSQRHEPAERVGSHGWAGSSP